MTRKNKRRQIHNNTSLLQSRAHLAGLAGQQFNGDRDLYQTFGYPQYLQPRDYRTMYDRGDIAGRVIDAYPDATWREAPTVEGLTNFETVADQVKLWSVMPRLDRLCQLGHYGVLLLGLDGGEPLETPARASNYRLLYIQPHSELTADITKWDDDPKSPRYNKPEMYNITSGPNWQGTAGVSRQLRVHHSRVIHIAEDALEHEAIGVPRLQRVYNRMMDIEKLAGGSAEMYWQNVAMMIAFIADKDVQFAESDKAEMAEQLEEMQHGLRRMLRLRGVEAHNLAPGLQGAGPAEHFQMQVDLVAAASGIPKRILLGNEAGELASSQDETAWQGRISERRKQFAVPIMLRPLIMRGLDQGWLQGTLKKDGISWPESDTLGEKGRAEVAFLTAQASSTYANTLGEPAVTLDEFRATLGLPPLPDVEFDENEGDSAQGLFDEVPGKHTDSI
jgi:uncharacterized protein